MRLRTGQSLANIVTLAFTLVLNTLANTLPLNGRTTGEISDSLDALFTPAGYVFGIWGLIYLGLVGFTLFQALPAQQANPRVVATGWWVALSNIANGLWIVCWHYGLIPLSMVAMLVLLGALIVIYRRVHAPDHPAPDGWTRWLVQAPFSLYLGWISVAALANAAALLRWLGWGGGNPEVLLTIVLILVAAGLALWLRDPIYALVIVWALAGILVRRSTLLPIALASAIGVAVCLGWLLVSAFRRRMAGGEAHGR
jgi:translocator protein